MSIQEYIEEHALGKKVEDVINAAVKAKAAEPISFMVRNASERVRGIHLLSNWALP
jgi:enolase